MKTSVAMRKLHICETCGLWLLLFCEVSWSTESLTPVREGTRYTMNCSGSTKSNKRKIHWNETRGSQKAEIISVCDNNPCRNKQMDKYKAAYFPNGYQYSSQLTILNVSAEHRNSTFLCNVLDYVDQLYRLAMEWSPAGIYLPPKFVDCHAAILSGVGDIVVWCQIEEFYPDIVCQVNIFFSDKSELKSIHMKRHDVVKSQPHYFKTNCSFVVIPNESGLYMFTVGVFPKVGNNAITSDVIQRKFSKYITCNPSININQLSGESPNCECPAYRYIECRAIWFDDGVARFEWYLDNLKADEGISETKMELRGKYFTYISILKITPKTANISKTVTCKLHFTFSNFHEKVYSDSKLIHICYRPIKSPYFKLIGDRDTVLGKYAILEGSIASFVCEFNDSSMEALSVTVTCMVAGANSVTVSNTSSVALSFNSNQTRYGTHCQCSTRSSDNCQSSTTTLSFGFGQRHVYPGYRHLDVAHISATVALATLAVMAFVLVCGLCLFFTKTLSPLHACPECDHIYENVGSNCGRTPRGNEESCVFREDDVSNTLVNHSYSCDVRHAHVPPRLQEDLPTDGRNHSDSCDVRHPHVPPRLQEDLPTDGQSTRQLRVHGCHCSQHAHRRERFRVRSRHANNAQVVDDSCDEEVDGYTIPEGTHFRDKQTPQSAPLGMLNTRCALKYSSQLQHLSYDREHDSEHGENDHIHLFESPPRRHNVKARQECVWSTTAHGVAGDCATEKYGDDITYISVCSSTFSSHQHLHAVDVDCFSLETRSLGTCSQGGFEDMIESPYIIPTSSRSSSL